MSPTSYQTAPPRDLMIAIALDSVKLVRALLLQLRTFTCINNFRWINGSIIHLFFENLSVLADQEIYAFRSLVFIRVDAVLVSGLTTQSLSSGKVTPMESAKALLAKGL